MLSDARELAADQQVETDLCIVGAGPAGISIARELMATALGCACSRAAAETWNAVRSV